MNNPEIKDIKSLQPSLRSAILFLILILFKSSSFGQQVPYHPVSYRIFSPFIFNPAIVGSKDFSSLDIITGWQGKSSSQLIAANYRVKKKGPDYFSSPGLKVFSDVGIGGYVFSESYTPSKNIGGSAAVSYQIPMDKQSLSFLSFGAAIKGVCNTVDSVHSTVPGSGKPLESTFYPNVDAGIYYYGPKVFAGFSATSLMGNPGDSDSLGNYRIPVSRQLFFVAGYKFLVSRSLNLVIEPSLIINADVSKDKSLDHILKPVLKVYAENFCVGTFFNDSNNISFFLQYRYPRFYLGAYFDIPRKTEFYKKELNVEFAAGINFSAIKSRNLKYYHW